MPTAKPPSSLAFDGATKDYVRDPDSGVFLSRHWVDSAAYYWLRVELGSVPSLPNVGQTITKIRYIDNTTEQQVEDRILTAWSSLLARGVIDYRGCTVDLSTPGAILYQANYVNLVLARKGVTPQLSFTP